MPSDDLLKYYMKKSDERFDRLELKIDDRLGHLEKKIDALVAFKWKLVGAASGASVVITIVFEVAKAIAGKQ